METTHLNFNNQKNASLICSITYAEDFRSFKISDGRKITARIKDYEPKRDMVRLELENRSVRSVKASVFTAQDQAYINDWFIIKSLNSEKSMRFSVQEIKGNVGRHKSGQPKWYACTQSRFREIKYEIKIQNRSGVAFDNVLVEYCTYHQKTINESSSKLRVRNGGPTSDGTPTTYHQEYETKEIPNKIEMEYGTGEFAYRSMD